MLYALPWQQPLYMNSRRRPRPKCTRRGRGKRDGRHPTHRHRLLPRPHSQCSPSGKAARGCLMEPARIRGAGGAPSEMRRSELKPGAPFCVLWNGPRGSSAACRRWQLDANRNIALQSAPWCAGTGPSITLAGTDCATQMLARCIYINSVTCLSFF